MTVSALNFKPYEKGAMRGFLDLRYFGLTIKGVRLMTGNNGLWLAFPQRQGTDDGGQVKYYDQLYLTAPEMDHVRRLVIADLQAQGHIQSPDQGTRGTGQQRPPQQGQYRSPEREDLSEHYTHGAEDDIPF